LVSHFVLYPRVAFRNDSKRARARVFFIFSPVGYIVPHPPSSFVQLSLWRFSSSGRNVVVGHLLISFRLAIRDSRGDIIRQSTVFLPVFFLLHQEKGKGGGRDSYVLFLKWRHSSNDFHLFEKGLAYVILTAGTTYYYRCCCWQRFISIPWTGGRKNSEIKWFSLEENHSVHMCVTFVCIHIFNIYLVF
jgi:hypothetical protein